MTLAPAGVDACRHRLDVVAGLWRKGGAADQKPSSWSPGSWKRWLPEHGALFERLPTAINRERVRTEFPDLCDETQSVEAFITAMIWGHGPVGYGAWRTQRILRDPDAPAKLSAAVTEVRAGGPSAGFLAMSDGHPSRLAGLGPAFGTKFLCFASDTSQPAPVLDALVAQWVRHYSNGLISVTAATWVVGSYERYLELLDELGADQELDRQTVEYLTFADAARAFSRRRSAWVEAWLLP
jgi:hypothetical protein